MTHLEKLEIFMNRLGWYSGKSVMTITLTGEFEGFYGKASEDWEQQVVIELKEVKDSSGKVICPALKVKGGRNDGIHNVAVVALLKLESMGFNVGNMNSIPPQERKFINK